MPDPLFPEHTPFKTEMLPVTDGHTLYLEQSGNPKGIPVVVLHGGPGSGSSDKSRRRFNPKLYHIIAFDQRGAGKSTPSGSLEANTTAHLIADIETIRIHLGLNQWVVYGTSWGSTLALAYAQTHPASVLGLIIGGVFLGTPEELDWLILPAGLPRFRPEEYRALTAMLPEQSPPQAILPALYAAVTSDDPERARAAAEAFAAYESSACFPEATPETLRKSFAEDPTFQSHITIELHYMVNRCFLEPDQLMKNMPRIAHLPTTILQGAMDFVCPPAAAHAVHAALPGSQLIMVPTSNHVANDDMETARTQATTALAKRLKGL